MSSRDHALHHLGREIHDHVATEDRVVAALVHPAGVVRDQVLLAKCHHLAHGIVEHEVAPGRFEVTISNRVGCRPQRPRRVATARRFREHRSVHVERADLHALRVGRRAAFRTGRSRASRAPRPKRSRRKGCAGVLGPGAPARAAPPRPARGSDRRCGKRTFPSPSAASASSATSSRLVAGPSRRSRYAFMSARPSVAWRARAACWSCSSRSPSKAKPRRSPSAIRRRSSSKSSPWPFMRVPPRRAPGRRATSRPARSTRSSAASCRASVSMLSPAAWLSSGGMPTNVSSATSTMPSMRPHRERNRPPFDLERGEAPEHLVGRAHAKQRREVDDRHGAPADDRKSEHERRRAYPPLP